MYEHIDILQIDKNIQTTLRAVTVDTSLEGSYEEVDISDNIKKRLSKQHSSNTKNQKNFYLLDTIELIDNYQ